MSGYPQQPPPYQGYPPQQPYGGYAAQPGYGAPPPQYGNYPPQQGYGAPPPQGYGAPPPGYGAPPPHYGDQGGRLGIGQYGAPPPATGVPVAGMGPMKGAERAELAQSRENLPNTWDVDLIHAPCAQPLYCCCSTLPFFCINCISMKLRKQALRNDMTKYVCCAGYYPCSGRCKEQSCPDLCLCLESFLCFQCSVAGTRFMIQDEMRIQNTKCDNCLIGAMLLAQQLACIFSLIAAFTNCQELDTLSDIISLIADILWCTVCACMQSQHKQQLDVRDGVTPAKNTTNSIQAPPQQPGMHR